MGYLAVCGTPADENLRRKKNDKQKGVGWPGQSSSESKFFLSKKDSEASLADFLGYQSFICKDLNDHGLNNPLLRPDGFLKHFAWKMAFGCARLGRFAIWSPKKKRKLARNRNL